MTKVTRQHFVEFFSPGTFMSESTRREISSWDTAEAVRLAKDVMERYDAKPYGFQFVTCLVAEPVPDGEGGTMEVHPTEVERSPMHYLGGRLLFYHLIPDDEKHSLLRFNMSGNRTPICIENNNSWKFTGEFNENHCIVDATGAIIRRGDDADLVEYRRVKNAEFEAEEKSLIEARCRLVADGSR